MEVPAATIEEAARERRAFLAADLINVRGVRGRVHNDYGGDIATLPKDDPVAPYPRLLVDRLASLRVERDRVLRVAEEGVDHVERA